MDGEGTRSPFAALIQVFKDTEHSVIAKVLRLKFRLNFTSPAYSHRRLKFPWFEIWLVRRIPTGALPDYANPEGRITRILTVGVVITLRYHTFRQRFFALDWPGSRISSIRRYFYFIPPSSLFLRVVGNFSALTTSFYDDFAI